MLNGYQVDKSQPQEVKILREQADVPVIKEEPRKEPSPPKKKSVLTSNELNRRNYNCLSHADRQDMKADEILALYLYRLSNRINSDYWRSSALPFVMLFRECLNEYGWGKKLESENASLEKNPQLKALVEGNQYCFLNGCEHAPEICNEFVTVFMESK